MKILLEMGKADVDALSGGSFTALHLAPRCGHIEAAALLIQRGAKSTPVDDFGKTPLN